MVVADLVLQALSSLLSSVSLSTVMTQVNPPKIYALVRAEDRTVVNSLMLYEADQGRFEVPAGHWLLQSDTLKIGDIVGDQA